MPFCNTEEHWGSIAKGLHWVMALLILAMIPLGWIAVNWPPSPTKVELFFWHKSLGMLLLALVALRVLWRVFNPPPAPPQSMPSGERRLASFAHLLLYVLMTAMPVSGWIINSAANFPLKIFGILPLPNIVAPSKAVQQFAENVHLTLFWILVAVLLLHVAAALRHHFIKKDNVLRRMLPGVPIRKRSPSVGDAL